MICWQQTGKIISIKLTHPTCLTDLNVKLAPNLLNNLISME